MQLLFLQLVNCLPAVIYSPAHRIVSVRHPGAVQISPTTGHAVMPMTNGRASHAVRIAAIAGTFPVLAVGVDELLALGTTTIKHLDDQIVK